MRCNGLCFFTDLDVHQSDIIHENLLNESFECPIWLVVHQSAGRCTVSMLSVDNQNYTDKPIFPPTEKHPMQQP